MSSPCGRQLLLAMFIFLGYQELHGLVTQSKWKSLGAKCSQSKVWAQGVGYHVF